MKAVKIGGAVCIYLDDKLPKVYIDSAITFDEIPVKPEGADCLDVVDGALVWVAKEPVPESGTEPTVWDELDAAYLEGVNEA